MHSPAPLSSLGRDVYSVTRLNREARDLLEAGFMPLWVEGEVSNLARPQSGHLYFSLKDAQCQVRCALFRPRGGTVNVRVDNGMRVLVRAQVSLYEGRGDFQLIVERLEAVGDGALRLAFEALRRRLAAEGLFDESHKRPLPRWPRCIGVITSPTGAALRDILSVLKRRCPPIPVVVYPVPVQGHEAGGMIAAAIRLADRRRDCEVVILARGGGSLEDLWAFNEEIVARAIYRCELPIVTGIGHEIDFTIADFAADRRAPTPSASAELVSPDRDEIGAQLATLGRQLGRRLAAQLEHLSMRMRLLAKRIVHPAHRLRERVQRLDGDWLHLARAWQRAAAGKAVEIAAVRGRLQNLAPRAQLDRHTGHCRQLAIRLHRARNGMAAVRRSRIETLARHLQGLSPLETLARGYAIVTDTVSGRVLRDATAARVGERVTARLGHGELRCRVEEVGTA
ncbi:MAG: exodeoxyribonuclease VII large subunit [Gammaproteobacteria bacterium]